MSDPEIPKTWEAALRWFVAGTIIFASGFEAVALFWDGKFLAAGGSLLVALALMALLLNWERLKAKRPRAMTALGAATADARLWAVLLVALAVFSHYPAQDEHGLIGRLIYALPLMVGFLLFLAA